MHATGKLSLKYASFEIKIKVTRKWKRRRRKRIESNLNSKIRATAFTLGKSKLRTVPGFFRSRAILDYYVGTTAATDDRNNGPKQENKSAPKTRLARGEGGRRDVAKSASNGRLAESKGPKSREQERASERTSELAPRWWIKRVNIFRNMRRAYICRA